MRAREPPSFADVTGQSEKRLRRYTQVIDMVIANLHQGSDESFAVRRHHVVVPRKDETECKRAVVLA